MTAAALPAETAVRFPLLVRYTRVLEPPEVAWTLTPRNRARKPNGRTLWFGTELDTGHQVWFRITAEEIGRKREEMPRARGERLIDAVLGA